MDSRGTPVMGALTPEEMRQRLAGAIEEAGGIRQLAHAWVFSVKYLEEVLEGEKSPSHSLLSYLGLRKEIVVQEYYVSSS